MRRGWVALWLFVLGTMLDALHIYTIVEHYPLPAFFGVAWWVPMLFGAAAVAIGYSHPLADQLLQHIRPTRSLLISLGEPTWLPCVYACASLAVGDLGRTLMFLHMRATL
ncbi:MAG TPA: hypothetical protein VFN02_06170 [Ktedonobacteraceae bacterium]|nr:hypothetical protein [Ktedonobacteraceae bacterium]